MSKVDAILEAVRALSDDEYVRLREALDQLDKVESVSPARAGCVATMWTLL